MGDKAEATKGIDMSGSLVTSKESVQFGSAGSGVVLIMVDGMVVKGSI